MRGDIVGIVDTGNNQMVEYKYDAWGKPLSTWTLTTAYQALASLNPLRYRGYVYDEETGLYYLRSRYYNPEWGRFLNSDVVIPSNRLLAQNLFSYCSNSPIQRVDRDGRDWLRDLIKNITGKDLNDAEYDLLKENPLVAISGYQIANHTDEMMKKMFGKYWVQDETIINAIRHCTWSAYLRYYLGEENAKKIGDAHEYKQIGTEWQDNANMDLHNNEVGRSIGDISDDVLYYSNILHYEEYKERYGYLFNCGFDSIEDYIIMDRVSAAVGEEKLMWIR